MNIWSLLKVYDWTPKELSEVMMGSGYDLKGSMTTCRFLYIADHGVVFNARCRDQIEGDIVSCTIAVKIRSDGGIYAEYK